MRREIPDGDIGAIFERALRLLLEETQRRKLAATTKPRAARAVEADSLKVANSSRAADSRHVSAEVKRAVWSRDDGQCAFVARNGLRCEARAFLEFHHVRPWSIGGATSVANISLRCRTHNAWEAELYFDRASCSELAPGQVGTSSTRTPCRFVD